MSTNFDAIKAHYAGSDTKDIGAMMAPITPETAWTEMDGFPYAGTYIGPDQIITGVFARIGADWDGFAFTLERLVDGGDTIVGIGTYTGTYKATGKALSARVTHVWTMAGGKVVRFEQFTDTLRFSEAMS